MISVGPPISLIFLLSVTFVNSLAFVISVTFMILIKFMNLMDLANSRGYHLELSESKQRLTVELPQGEGLSLTSGDNNESEGFRRRSTFHCLP